jgi:hypothetical protein
VHLPGTCPAQTQVSDTLLSIATLTDESMADMHSVDTAPKLVATLVGKGADFSNTPGQPEGIPALPQVRACMHMHTIMFH